MKTDMAGAAAVLAAVVAAAEEKLAVEVHALAACTENMPSGSAYKLGDVIRSLDGKTVEINNTDAEGRLTLADALSFGAALQARRRARLRDADGRVHGRARATYRGRHEQRRCARE